MSEIRTYTVEWAYGDEGGRGWATIRAYDAQDAVMQVQATWGPHSFNRIVAVAPREPLLIDQMQVR